MRELRAETQKRGQQPKAAAELTAGESARTAADGTDRESADKIRRLMSMRLRTVAGMVRGGGCLADIGTDHAYVPVFLVASGQFERALALDINAGPLERARENIREARLENRIRTRLSDGMAALIRDTGAELIVDATHPYAAEVTRTLKAVADQAGVEYLRVLRGEDHEELAGCVLVDDTPGAVAYLNGTEGPVLLTVGSKELFQYTAVTDWQNRLYARVLPLPASTEIAFKLGFTGSHLICMQGPFSQEINEAMLRMLDCRYLVTKDTGAAGGFAEKIRAARACGVTPIVIRRPVAEAMKEAGLLQ